jgi:hypothetical protein
MPRRKRHRNVVFTWLRRRSAGIFTISLLAIGTGLLGAYLLAPEYHITIPSQGFGGAITQGITLTQLYLVLLTEETPPHLDIGGIWSSTQQQNGSAYLMFVIPFDIEYFVLTPISQPKNWMIITYPSSTTVIYTMISNNTRKFAVAPFNAEFGVATTFEASKRGVTTVVIPLGLGLGGPSYSDIAKVQNQLRVSFVSPPSQSVDVYIALPLSADVTQTYPAPSSAPTPYEIGNAVHWTLTQLQTVSVSYVDRDTVSAYDAFVIIGSIALGTATSGVHDWLRDWAKGA